MYIYISRLMVILRGRINNQILALAQKENIPNKSRRTILIITMYLEVV